MKLEAGATCNAGIRIRIDFDYVEQRFLRCICFELTWFII